MNNIYICELNSVNHKLTQNYKMGGVVILSYNINNKVVEVKKIDHEKTSMNY